MTPQIGPAQVPYLSNYCSKATSGKATDEALQLVDCTDAMHGDQKTHKHTSKVSIPKMMTDATRTYAHMR